MVPNPKSYLIIGAGVFGASTAYRLIKKHPDASVTIVDRDAFDADSRVAASWDWNKVVRADYDDLLYCRMAIEAQDVFNSDPLFRPYFHETGIYWMCRNEYARDVINNYAKLGRKADLKAVKVDDAKKMFGGLFADADYTGVKEVLVNRTSGWANAGDVLRAVTREAIRLGVSYVVADVASVELDGNNRCIGISTTDGKTLRAAHTILSTGAYTAKLLELSAHRTGVSSLSAGDRILAGGITTGMVKLDEESYTRFANMPVGMQGYLAETGPFLGSLPPTKDRELKWWGQKIFSNHQEVLPGRVVSAPPDRPDYAQWEVSDRLKDDIDFVNETFYGKNRPSWKYEKHRICWDAFTSSSDFIISPHSGAEGLYVATCGSFHGFKFFPVIGKYVIAMLEDQLEPDAKEKWAWDRKHRPDAALNGEYPRSEMKDLLDDPKARTPRETIIRSRL